MKKHDMKKNTTKKYKKIRNEKKIRQKTWYEKKLHKKYVTKKKSNEKTWHEKKYNEKV